MKDDFKRFSSGPAASREKSGDPVEGLLAFGVPGFAGFPRGSSGFGEVFTRVVCK